MPAFCASLFSSIRPGGIYMDFAQPPYYFTFWKKKILFKSRV